MSEANVFEECPVYRSEHFLLRQMRMEDAKGLFQCYSNPEAAKYFNGDCCGDDFYYTDFSRFVKCMEFWESRYQEKDFVRFTIVYGSAGRIAGMAEICPSYKYSADGACMGILRLDLLPEYETREDIQELMELILKHVYEDFQVRSVIMKAQEDARIRRSVLKGLCFVPAQDECSIPFKDYFIRY
ncbi:N-acetyltransferase [Petralouisia muris]|jgi:RimJ/RimL family protein N-acetyltransferase|uniref:N-acetyltransferase n=1 Tax=Petralouisia muris TaxID=3032872 RepID=A0AC61RS93_9FIRM|nr:GNAT family protein [Petralouisia muris]TGY91791.1 N-acetyltransferase [Petralouisia muris]